MVGVSDEGQKSLVLNAVAPKNYITIFKDIDYRIQSLPFYSGINGPYRAGIWKRRNQGL